MLLAYRRQRRKADVSRAELAEANSELELRVFERTERMTQEIQERRQIEAELFESQERYALAFAGANDGLWDWEINAAHVYVSPRMRELVSLSPAPEGITPKHIEERVHPDDRALYRAAIVAHIKGLTPSFNGEFRVTDGKDGWRWVLLRGVALRRNDRAYRLAGSVTDISERKRTEAALAQARDDAEQATRAKSDFLAGMSHELRTPLNAIIGFSQVMGSEMLGPLPNGRYREYIEMILSSGQHLLALINDILDLAKIEAGKMDLRADSVRAAAVARAAIELVRPSAERQRVLIRLDIANPVLALRADERRLRQILINLISNAVKFSPENGEVVVMIHRDEEGRAIITVSDHGVGMTEKEIATALEAFGQAHPDIASNQEGTGLGLPITKMLVEMHGGRLDIESKPGQGTCVIVIFPRDRVLAY